MGSSDVRVALVTGASSGIGLACANHLARKGYCVYGTSRFAPALGAEVAVTGQDVYYRLIPMDVTSEDSVCEGVHLIVERHGRVDVAVNNAGIGYGGAIEETSIAEARSQLETNFLGALRVCRAVLPIMRQHKRGYIVNISSIAGLVGIPFQGLYSASKFAMEGMTEALRLEVRPYNIHVCLLEPGDLRTGFTANRIRTLESQQSSPYANRCFAALRVMEGDETGGGQPEIVARALERILSHPAPPLRQMVGPLWERAAASLKGFVPPSLFEWAVARYYKLR